MVAVRDLGHRDDVRVSRDQGIWVPPEKGVEPRVWHKCKSPYWGSNPQGRGVKTTEKTWSLNEHPHTDRIFWLDLTQVTEGGGIEPAPFTAAPLGIGSPL